MPRLCAALGEASLRLPLQAAAVLDGRRGRPRPGRGGRLIIDRCNPCALLTLAVLLRSEESLVKSRRLPRLLCCCTFQGAGGLVHSTAAHVTASCAGQGAMGLFQHCICPAG